MIVACASTVLSLIIGVPAAYVFARHDFRGKEDLFFFFLTTRMAPPVSVVVPMFLLFGFVGLIDTRISVILAHSTFNLSLDVSGDKVALILDLVDRIGYLRTYVEYVVSELREELDGLPWLIVGGE